MWQQRAYSYFLRLQAPFATFSNPGMWFPSTQLGFPELICCRRLGDMSLLSWNQ